MAPFAGSLLAAAALLVLAGGVKVIDPSSTRVALRTAGLPASSGAARALGLVEVTIGGAALAVGGLAATAAVALTYVGFAGFARHLHRASRGRADCGCFGGSSAPVSPLHVWVNVAVAAAVASTLAAPVAGLADVADRTPASGLVLVGLAALQAWLVMAALTVLPRALAAATARPPRPPRDLRSPGTGSSIPAVGPATVAP
jgi:hypothetical protein